MADSSSNLEIVISAVDQASAAIEEVNANVESLGTAAATMVDETTASFNEFIASIDEAAAVAGVDQLEIMRQMEATGLTAQQVSEQIVASNEEVDASNELSKGSF